MIIGNIRNGLLLYCERIKQGNSSKIGSEFIEEDI